MKRLIVVLVLVCPFAVTAEERDPEPKADSPTAIDTAAQGEFSISSSAWDQPKVNARTDGGSESDLHANLLSQNRKPQSSTSSEPPPSRRGIGGTMLGGGYIDDAIIRSEIRIRFDAAYNNGFPDLAEFFYAKCGCYKAWAPSTALDPTAPGPGLGVPTRVNFQQLYLRAEYAPKRHFSFYVEVPSRWLQPQGFVALGSPFSAFPNTGGISDIQAGIKAGMVIAKKNFFTLQLQGSFPTGNASRGLGTNHYSIQPELTYYGIMSKRATIVGEAGIWLPIGGSTGIPTTGSTTNFTSGSSFAGNIFFYGIGPSYKLYDGEKVQIAPVLEMVGWHILGGYVTDIANPIILGGPILSGIADPASGINIVNLKFGVRTNFGRNSIYVGFGHQLTHNTWYQDIFRLEYRYVF